MTQLGELAKLLDSIGARGEDRTAEKSIQPPALGGEVRAWGRAGQGRGRREGSAADPGALPTRLCPASVSPRAPRAACSKGCPDPAPGSAQAWAAPGDPAELRAASPGKAWGSSPSFRIPQAGPGMLSSTRAGQRYGAQPRQGMARREGEWDGERASSRLPGSREVEAAGEIRATRSSRGGAVGIRPFPSGRHWQPSTPHAPLTAEAAAAPSRRCLGPPRRAPPPHSKRGPAAPSGGGGGQAERGRRPHGPGCAPGELLRGKCLCSDIVVRPGRARP